VLEKYPNDVKLVIKHFPLNIHEYAKKAAVAALAAGKQGKFWEMHEKLFADQQALGDAKVEAIAKDLGLNMDQFNADLKDPAVSALIERDLSDGTKAAIPGTPAIFVNGRLLQQRSPQGFQQAIETELKKKK
jgi:protein-disulfide isomerase